QRACAVDEARRSHRVGDLRKGHFLRAQRPRPSREGLQEVRGRSAGRGAHGVQPSLSSSIGVGVWLGGGTAFGGGWGMAPSGVRGGESGGGGRTRRGGP